MPADPLSHAPRVLGIDPGIRACGWGLLRAGGRGGYIDCGVIRPKTTDRFPRRLLFLHDAIKAIIDEHEPQELAIEDPFVGALSPRSAMVIGQARAAAVLAGASRGLEVEFYAPAAVKAAVSGYGQSDKRQVQSMVRLLLGLDAPPEPLDAADALAVALCHLAQRRMRSLAAR